MKRRILGIVVAALIVLGTMPLAAGAAGEVTCAVQSDRMDAGELPAYWLSLHSGIYNGQVAAYRSGEPVSGTLATGDEVRGADSRTYGHIVVAADVLGSTPLSLTHLARLAAALSGGEPLEGLFLQAGDLNGNGRIDLADLVQAAALLAASRGQAPALIREFLDPDVDAKPMARMWFPDAGAGADDNDTIEKQILELADKGFGGVEVAMLADGVSYDNAASAEIGWGTENWRNLLKKVLKAAAKVDGGFQVDCTITAHWPPCLNTLDPNDEAASKELAYSLTKLDPQAAASGPVDIEMPERKIQIKSDGWGGSGAKDIGFVFTDELVSAAIVRVSRMDAETDEATGAVTVTPTFDFSTIIPVTERVLEDQDGGSPAGIPDEQTAEALGVSYEDICSLLGPEPTGALVDGKRDAEGNRARMADWQSAYAIDLTETDIPDEAASSDGGDVQAGDWVILSTFCRGTGQALSGGAATNLMANRTFVTSYYNEAGTKAVTDYWDDMLAEDPELLELMRANPANIFEDSIEASCTTSFWATGLEDDAASFEHADIMPMVAVGRHSQQSPMGSSLYELFHFENDHGLADRIYEDYCSLLADAYMKYRLDGVRSWANDTLGWGFRGQTYQLPGLEVAKASAVADVPEADNCSKGDGIRYLSGTRNINNKKFLTIEGMTGPMQEYVTMDDVLTELGQNYSDGVNRAILHGTPYSKTFNGYNSEWPGWLAFGPGSFGSAYTYRAAYWDDVATETGYMSRIQAVLQNGQAQIDLAVLIDKEVAFSFTAGNRFQDLLDAGYSYNLLSEASLDSDEAYARDGRLAPDGPAYKAVILDEVTTFDLENMDKLFQYADNGVPVILLASPLSKVYGSNVADDAVLAERLAALRAKENVVAVSSVDEVQGALERLGVEPRTSYDVPQLEATLYADTDTGATYCYLFNNPFPENEGMMGNSQATRYKGEEHVIRDADITLSGTGTPYVLDPHTGEVTEAAEYATNPDGTVTVRVQELRGGDSLILCVTDDTTGFPASVQKARAWEESADRERIDLGGNDWSLLLHSYGPGSDETDPSVSSVTDVDFGARKLAKWEDLPATSAQLAALGVPDMKYVAGVAEYTTTFLLPDDWNSADEGAFLDVAYGKNQVGSITVNGTTLAANNATDRKDIGGWLRPGENTLTIKLSSTLYPRVYLENSGYEGKDFGMGSGFMQPVEEGLYYNGLMGATLTPYVLR